MRGLGLVAAATAPVQRDPPLPGIAARDRARLNVEARDALDRALAEGRQPRDVALHLQPDSVTVEDRRELVLGLRAAGSFTLARRIERAAPPAGHVVVFVDVEGETCLRLVPLAALDITTTAPSAVLATGGG